ncbi:hypothetical protein Pcar_3470 [Syntrophotalea carbinolica DSM 2380]|uniref:Uncharacterized protein n=1 Tax=Syntrophotalea carbinolica (strain DSM 2380 / NBRC 103641 / GraBd1) TaxID=338963 RepID=J9TJH7_SYNC1|nr:hypothetical protein Pcar_3470 [Syntrophotalea carbinolica DSM 2380]
MPSTQNIEAGVLADLPWWFGGLPGHVAKAVSICLPVLYGCRPGLRVERIVAILRTVRHGGAALSES